MEVETATAGEDPREEPVTTAPEGSAPEPQARLARIGRALQQGFAPQEAGSLRLWR